MALEEDTIEIAALGRPFQLGTLYDCRKDALIPGVTLWDYSSLQKDLTIKPQPKTATEIIASDSIDDKVSALEISEPIKASFLGGLIDVRGSAEYLHDTKKSKQQARVTVQYKTTTKYEQLTMSHLGIQNVSYPAVFEHGTATHVVTAILYGAQAFFVFDQEVSSTEMVKDIQGSLQVTIKKELSITGQADMKLNEEEKESALKCNCKFHGDFSLDKNLVTFQDAMKVYESLPKILGKDGEKAVPMRIWLYPLSKLDTRAAKMVREINLMLVFDANKILEELNEIQMQSNDLANDPIAETFPEIKRKILQFKDLLKQHRQIFQKQLARMLPSIRGGGQEEGTLRDLLMSVKQSPFNNQRLCEFLDSKKSEINHVNSCLTILNNIEVISSQNKLEKIVLDPQNLYVVSFTFTSLHEEEPFLLSLQEWLQEEFLPESLKSTRSTPEVKKCLAWFEDKERTHNARQVAKSIDNFFSINQPNEKVRFVVASLPDVDTPGTSTYLYEDGELVSKNFELPSKPLPFLISELRHDSIQLKFQPAEYGRATISNYLVEYKVAGEEKWKTVRTEDSRETFLLKDLSPNSDYLFRYAAFCKVGHGRTSDQSQSIKTLPTRPPEKLRKVSMASADNVALQFLQKSSLVEDRQSFTLPLEKIFSDASTSGFTYQLGKKNLEMSNKVILVMGATGCGKTTLINGMINYILGVRWEDSFRFKFIHEITQRDEARNETSEVTSYVVNHQKGFRIPYSLTIIDTPGFGGTRDAEQDKLVEKKLLEFFSTPGGIDHVDAICLVGQAFLVHSTHAHKCFFDYMLSMLGKNVKDNVQLLITFSDGGTPPVLEALKEADLSGSQDESGTPVHFKFNHSALFAPREYEGSPNAAAEIFWKMSNESMKNFFDSLKMLESKNLTLTMEVLKKRQDLGTDFRRPPSLKVEPIQPKGFQISIDPLTYGMSPVSRYLVEYRIAGEQNWKCLLTDVSRDQFTLEDFHLNLPYQFRCVAVTQLAFGQWSEEITCVYNSDCRGCRKEPPTKEPPIHPHGGFDSDHLGGKAGRKEESVLVEPGRRQSGGNLEEDNLELQQEKLKKSQVLCSAAGPEMTASIQGSERRIVLVGNCRSGKSATGNTILGRKLFKSAMSLGSVTQVCQKEETQLNGRKVVVVDTPGFFHTSHPDKDIAAEVSKCVKLCSPGPHVILQVMHAGRFTQYDKDVAQQIKEIFGLKVKDYIILLFTHKDYLKGKSLENFISLQDKKLKEYVSKCGNQFLAFNNKAEGAEREAQVAELMAMIDDLVETNKNAPCYTEDMMNFNKQDF